MCSFRGCGGGGCRGGGAYAFALLSVRHNLGLSCSARPLMVSLVLLCNEFGKGGGP